MARSEAAVYQARTFALLCGVAVIAALYFAKQVLLPFALAILLSFLLTPVVRRLERWGLGRIPAVLIVVVICFGAIGAASYVMVQQLYDLAYQLPEYKDNIVNKAQAFRSEDGVLDKVSETMKEVREQITPKRKERESPSAEGPAAAAPPAGLPSVLQMPHEPNATVEVPFSPSEEKVVEPVPVEVIDELSAPEIAQSILEPLLAPVGTAALVVVFVIFMLLSHEDLRDRLIQLIGSRQVNVTTQALDDAAYRVSRYLLMQLIINSLYGLVIALGLFLIGLPNAFLWGALATIFRFVPYVGPWIAAVIPIAVSLAVFDGWSRPLMVVGLFVLNELVSNNLLEPWLYGSSTGISTIGIITSAVFWTWLWGPVGLVLATPLTVCLTVLGDYVPQLRFFNTLFSDQEVLAPQTRFYQRLLAGDPEEAIELAEEHLEEHSLDSLYETILLPALGLAEQDRHHGELDEMKQSFIAQTTRELVEDLGAKEKQASATAAAADAEESDTEEDETQHAAAEAKRELTILCLPARDEADEIAGMMLAQMLERRGVRVIVGSAQRLASERISDVEKYDVDALCISALPPFAAMHARYLCKRLRPKYPKLRIVVGLWQGSVKTKKAQQRLMETGIDRCVTTLSEAVEQLIQLTSSDRLLAKQEDASPTTQPAA